MKKQRFTIPFLSLIIALGSSVFLYSLTNLYLSPPPYSYLILAITTILVGSRLGIKIPRIGGEITVSDTFLFLVLILYGGPQAVVLSGIEAFYTTTRFSKKYITYFFNAAMMALSTAITSSVLHYFFDVTTLLKSGLSEKFLICVCVIALVQYAANSGFAATAFALKNGNQLWETWKTHYLWTSVTYFAGASAAGAIAKVVAANGWFGIIAIAPIVVIIYFTYVVYLKNVQSAATQAEQAERHLSELRESEAQLRASEALFRGAFDHAAGMALLSPHGRWIEVNDSLCEMLGFTEAELLATGFQSIVHPDDLGPMLTQLDKLTAKEISSCQIEQRHTHKNGHPIWALLSVTNVPDAQGNSANLIFQIQDITDRKRAEEQLIHEAMHDGLTQLPNRTMFMDHLKISVERSKRRKDISFAVLFLDFDRFKIINDSLGHQIGDQLLIGIARRLEKSLRPGDTVARLGGDEFTILLEDLNSLTEATNVAERIQLELSVPFNLGGHEVYTSVSIGIATSMTGYDHAAAVLRDADTAMYRAKSHGKARYEIFDQTMHAHASNLLQLETDLRRALEREELEVYYQPIITLDTGCIRGFEALVRWQHPERGFISPTEFIPIAEESLLINKIGLWVLTQACRQIKIWQQDFPQDQTLQVSVNLSGKQFIAPDLIGQIKRVIQETGVNPHCLKLEITESMMMENIELVIGTLEQLRAIGLELSIDDFGTGYSSLSYLHRLPASTLKIDRSFVSRMNAEGENAEIVKTITSLARHLKMSVVAEGVETLEQANQLIELGCEYGQGYYFSPAATVQKITKLLEAQIPMIAPAPLVMYQVASKMIT
jgi:diguanylate cyclase (GGDEF)-like protein/PAS domain S-box-containing protein